jgi:putative membrane protein
MLIAKLIESPIIKVFRFKGYLIQRLYPSMIWVAFPTSVIYWIDRQGILNLQTSFAFPGLLGAALGILLVFRNNTAYERWWEGRKLLGSLMNTVRSLAILIKHTFRETQKTKDILSLLAAMPFVLKNHLRDDTQIDELSFLAPALKEAIMAKAHKPLALMDELTRLLHEKVLEDHVSDVVWVKIQESLEAIVYICGGCERIRNTPMPLSYSYILKLYVYLYTLVMPFGFIGSLGWWSVPAVCAVFFVTMSIVLISEEIEEPFGEHPDDLPMDAMAERVYQNLKEIYPAMDSAVNPMPGKSQKSAVPLRLGSEKIDL